MRILTFAACLALLGGCASERIVLLPSADGRPSAVVLNSPAGEQRLAEPYAASLRVGGTVSGYQSSVADVQERFGQALGAQPQRAVSFVLYFAEGGDTLTPESAAEIDKIKALLQSRAAPEIVVVGHTDRVGSVEANDALSMKRAETVRDSLVASGLEEKVIAVAGRGEREPAVPTDDEVSEPRNRRVEITVR